MAHEIINTPDAPAAIGPYSQAVKAGNTVYLSGCIALEPETGLVIDGDVTAQARRAFLNFEAICKAAGGSLKDVVKLGLFVTDLDDFAAVNAVMSEFFEQPYPARSTVEVSALPRGVMFEVDGILVLE